MVFGIVVAIGCVVAVVVTAGIGTLHDQPYERGQAIGTGVGTFAVIAGAVAYFVQAKRIG